MKKSTIYIVSACGDSPRGQRIARLMNKLAELEGVTVATKEEASEAPRVNVGTIGHINHGRALNPAIVFVLSSRELFPEVKLEAAKPKRDIPHCFAKLRKQHSQRSRQQIKRSNLTPRIMKNMRCRRFR